MRFSLRRAELAGAVALAVSLLTSSAASAVAQRTFVSTLGVDNAACSLATPCRTFDAAIAATAVAGEVIVLDSGGYGPVTIAQSVSITAPAGVYAGISAMTGPGVTIATATGDTVVLTGVSVNNQGSAGRGISIVGAGVVRLDRIQVSGFTGASALGVFPSGALQLHVRNSVFRKSAYGIALNYFNASATAQISGTIADSEMSNNDVDGLGIGNNTFMTLSRSIVAKNNELGIGFAPTAGQINHLNVDDCAITENAQGLYPGDKPGNTVLQVSRSRIVGNGTGLAAGANSITRLSENVIENNGFGINIGAGGTVESAGNNVLRGNTNAEPVLGTFPMR